MRSGAGREEGMRRAPAGLADAAAASAGRAGAAARQAGGRASLGVPAPRVAVAGLLIPTCVSRPTMPLTAR